MVAARSPTVGAATAAGAGRVLATWGPGTTPGVWAAVVLGVAAAVVAVSRPAPVVLAAVLVGGLLTGIRPADTAAADGPFVPLADLADSGMLRSGAAALPASDLRLTLLDGAAAAVTADGIATFGHGHVRVVARVPADDRVRHAGGILGVAGDRVARFVAPGTLLVTGLRPGDPTAVHIRGVADASAVGSDGTVWLRGYGEPAAAVRRLDLHAYPGAVTLDVTVLPVVTVDAPVGAAPLAAADLLPVPDGALRRTANRLERVTAAPGRTVVTLLAGGLDPACGLTAVARSATLGAPGPFSPLPDGGAWLAANGRLLRVDPDGVLRAVRAPLPGPAVALVTTPDGGLVVATREELWAVPPNVPLEDLPPTRSDCVPDPPPAGPPAGLVPITNTGTDRLGVPLGVDGRWASATRDGQISTVSADGRTRVPLGVRPDAQPGPVWPDGAGGVWWLEGATPVHTRPARPEARLPPVPLPAERLTLIPDLGDRPPLVATPDAPTGSTAPGWWTGPSPAASSGATGAAGARRRPGDRARRRPGAGTGDRRQRPGRARSCAARQGRAARARRAGRRVPRARRAGPGGGARRRRGARDQQRRRGAPGGAGPAPDRPDHRRGRARAARRQRRAAPGGSPRLGRVPWITGDGLRDPDGSRQGGGRLSYRAYSSRPTTQPRAIWREDRGRDPRDTA